MTVLLIVICILIGYCMGMLTFWLIKRPRGSYRGQVIMQGLVGSPVKDSDGKMLSPAPHFSMTLKNKLDGAAMIRLEGDNRLRDILRDGSVGYIWQLDFHLVGKKVIGGMFVGDKRDGQVALNASAFGGNPDTKRNPFL